MPEIRITFPNLSAKSAPNFEEEQILATGQWKLKEPPADTGTANNNVYPWTSLVSHLCLQVALSNSIDMLP